MPSGVHSGHLRGPNHHGWKGGRRTRPDGYVMIRASLGDEEYEHRVVIEKALGKPIPKGAITHHVDENRSNNANNNLVLCENHAYHKMIHNRIVALKETGNKNSRKCHYCHKWDLPENMYINKKAFSAHHRSCHAKYNRERRQKKIVEQLYPIRIILK